MTPDDPRHGTTRGHYAGCRDLCCRRAIARYEKEGRLARRRGGRAIPALGARRRLQALMALGWSSHAIAVHADLPHRNHVWRIVNGQKGKPTKWVTRDTWAWVCEVYDELSMTVPATRYARRTRAHAEAREWPPPLAWDDIDDPDEQPGGGATPLPVGVDRVVVQRLLDGEWGLRSSPAEKAEACRQWRSSGRSLGDLAKRSGWKVERYFKVSDEVAA